MPESETVPPQPVRRSVRDDIVQAAVALVDELGDPYALSLRGIARRAGVSAPAIYGYFADLEAVIEAVVEQSFVDLGAATTEASAGHDDPVSALLAGCRAYVDYGLEHPGRYRAMFLRRPHDAAAYGPQAIEVFRTLATAVRRCLSESAAGRSQVSQSATALWAGLNGLVTFHPAALASAPTTDEIVRTLVAGHVGREPG